MFDNFGRNTMSLKKFIVSTAVFAISVAGMSVAQPILAKATDSANVACTNGDTKQDFTGEWISRDTVKFATAGGKKLCKDVTINVSSYVMPDNYNGEKFMNNPTATPQTLFNTKKVTLKAGTNGASTVTIKAPSVCKNVQTDAYVGPEITVVGPKGHDGHAFATQILKKATTGCDQPKPVEKVDACNTDTKKVEKVEKGKENVTPHLSDLSKCDAQEDEPAATELPHTGASSTMMIALPLSLLVAGVVSYAQKR